MPLIRTFALCFCPLFMTLFANVIAIGDEPASAATTLENHRRDDTRPVYAHPESDAILNSILVDWMTNPDVKQIPYDFLKFDDSSGKSSRKELRRLLIDQYSAPVDFKPEIVDIKIELYDYAKHKKLEPGEMKIRFIDFQADKSGQVEVQFLHSGYQVFGGARAKYKAKKIDGKWKATLIRVSSA